MIGGDRILWQTVGLVPTRGDSGLQIDMNELLQLPVLKSGEEADCNKFGENSLLDFELKDNVLGLVVDEEALLIFTLLKPVNTSLQNLHFCWLRVRLLIKQIQQQVWLHGSNETPKLVIGSQQAKQNKVVDKLWWKFFGLSS